MNLLHNLSEMFGNALPPDRWLTSGRDGLKVGDRVTEWPGNAGSLALKPSDTLEVLLLHPNEEEVWVMEHESHGSHAMLLVKQGLVRPEELIGGPVPRGAALPRIFRFVLMPLGGAGTDVIQFQLHKGFGIKKVKTLTTTVR